MFAPLAVLFSFAFSLPVLAKNDSTTYRCHAKDAVSVLQDGTLSKQIGHVAEEQQNLLPLGTSSNFTADQLT
jgi:hypothetical protein